MCQYIINSNYYQKLQVANLQPCIIILQLLNIQHSTMATITQIPKTDIYLFLLFLVNLLFLLLHIHHNCQHIYYFFQLTIIGQVIVTFNFLLSIVLHEKKSGTRIRRFLSRLHLMTLGLQSVIVLGFWGLRIFFTKGILAQGEVMSPYTQFLSFYVHGGSFATMFYFIKTDQIMMEPNKNIKYLIHSFWGIPFLFLQALRWYMTGSHIYGFIHYFTWVQVIVFELTLFLLAIGIDYLLSIRHGYKLTIKHMNSEKKNIQELQRQKHENDKKQYEAQQKVGIQFININKGKDKQL